MTKYYELTARYDRRASFYGKAHIKETPRGLVLISYDTEILRLDKTTNALQFLCCSEWVYTQTTNRHINEFLKQFTNESPKSKSEILTLAGVKS